MVSSTDTQTGTDAAVINGINVSLTADLPNFATDSFDVSADITTGASTQDINVALVIDTSGSTRLNSGSDVDGDGDADTYLEAQQLAAKALFQSFVDAGYDPAAVTITLIEYNTDAATVGEFSLADQAGFDSAIDDLDSGGRTSFDDALDEVIADWRGTTTDGNADDSPESEVTANDSNLVVFLSDGWPNEDGTNFTSELNILENEFDADITAIGVGANSNLAQLDVIDNTGGATQVTDLSQLSSVINAPPPLPDLQEIQIILNGSVLETIPADDPRIVSTALGYRLDCEEITGYPYVVGDTLDVEVQAVFTPNGETLLVDGFALPMFVCFVEGTMILTPEGAKPIETLCLGDRVITRDHGAQPIRWIGATRLPAAALAARPETRPVRIRAGALGDAMPERDLRLSRQHRVLVRGWRAELLFGSPDGVLTPAFTLINDSTILSEPPVEDVVYFHMAFDQHEVVYSEGVETESFHANADTVSVLTEPQRAELHALFPELVQGQAAYPAARIELRGREGRALGA